MTIIEDGAPGGTPARQGSEREFDRTPPQAIEAEQSVLGAMMLSKDAIADVIEVIRPGDFYRPAHQQIYDSVLDLYSRGEPADAVTVSAELTRAGQLNRVGGAPYLHTLISLVPTAANAGYYAAIVADRATLRRLVSAGTRIVQMGYEAASGSGDELAGTIDDVVDRAQVEIYDVTERRLSEDYFHIETLLQPTLDEIEKISASGGVIVPDLGGANVARISWAIAPAGRGWTWRAPGSRRWASPPRSPISRSLALRAWGWARRRRSNRPRRRRCRPWAPPSAWGRRG